MDLFLKNVIRDNINQLDIIPPAKELIIERLTELAVKKRDNPPIPPYVKHCINLNRSTWEQIFGSAILAEDVIAGEEIISELKKYKAYPIGTENHLGWYFVEEDGYDAQDCTSEYCCDCDARKDYDGEYHYNIILHWDKDNWAGFLYTKTYEIDYGGGKVMFNSIEDEWLIDWDMPNGDNNPEFVKLMKNELLDLVEIGFPIIYERCFKDGKRPRSDDEEEDVDLTNKK